MPTQLNVTPAIERSFEDDVRECYQLVFEGMIERGKTAQYVNDLLAWLEGKGKETDEQKRIIRKRILGEVAATFGVKP